MKYYETLNPNSLVEIFEVSSPALAEIANVIENGEHLVKALLTKSIEDLNTYFNVSSQMTTGQRVELINLIYQKYSYFKLADFKLCFVNAKTGMYGKIYNRIDGQIIFEWLGLYAVERMEFCENNNRRKHEEEKRQDINKDGINLEGQRKVIEIFKSVVEKPIEIKPKQPREKTEIEKFVQKCLTNFDKIYNKKRDNLGQKFIKRYGKVLTASEYLEYKMEQKIRVDSRTNKNR